MSWGQRLATKAFVFACKDSSSDKGWANIVLLAESIMECKALLKQHLVRINRTDLFGKLQLMQRVEVTNGVLFSTVESGQDPLPIINQPDASEGVEPSLGRPFIHNYTRPDETAEQLFERVTRAVESLPTDNPCGELPL